jgi:hypothetical protein
LCPSGTYSDTDGLEQCKPCPLYELARATGRNGLSSIEKCGSFRSSGIWWGAGTGNVAGGAAWATTLPRGTGPEYAIDLTDELPRDVISVMAIGTNFEARQSSTGWTAKTACSEATEFSAVAEYYENIDVLLPPEGFCSHQVSESVVSSLSEAVSPSIVNFTADACELRCNASPGALVAYGWRWIQLVFDTTTDEIVMSVETCETLCMYSAKNIPQCPPRECSNSDCSLCFSGTFADSEIDRIASEQQMDPPVAQSGLSMGAIIGIACGGGVVVAMIVALVWWRSCRGGFPNQALHPVAEPVFPYLATSVTEPVTVQAELFEPSAQRGPTFKDQMRANRHGPTTGGVTKGEQ